MEEPQSHLQLPITDCRETRIIGKIRDFLFSQASAINPSIIEQRIQELFTSFETPTHPAYAWMIHNALKDLNERNGSTEEAISEFIKNEFQDLPWAHSRILGLHLGKLCQAGELFRTASCRYMLMDDYVKFNERKEKGWSVGRRRKKNKRERNCRGGETLERIEGAKRCNELNERENEQNHLSESHGAGTNETIEEKGKYEIGQLGVTEACHGQVVRGQGEAQKQPDENTYKRIQEAIMELKDKISSSKIMNTEPHMVSLLPSNDSIVDKRNPRHCKIKKQLQLRPDGQGWGRGRGRSYKLDGNSHKHNEHLVDSSSEGSPGCIMGETAALQLEPQMSWDRLVYGGITSQMEDSLSSMNGLEDKSQQHMNKGGPKRKLNLDGKTECEHLEQQSSKRRCRGRPPAPGSTEDCSWSWVPVVPSNNCIHNGKKPNFWNIVEHRILQSPQDQAQV